MRIVRRYHMTNGYHSCSFLRFLIRAFVQFMFLTPKPAIFPEPPADRPYIGAIIGTNLLCLFLHAIYASPAAGEATRGYLHGGLAMDFIGQKGPTSKMHLLLLDLLVVLLQIIHLSAHVTRQRLKGVSVSVTTSAGREYTPAAAPSTQDLDSEERGVRRSDEQQDIEMRTLDSSGVTATSLPADEPETTSERDNLLTSSITTAPRTDAHIFDAFNSGQIVLADLDIIKTTKEQFWAYQAAPRESLQSSREMRANIAGQLLRWRFGATVGRPAQSV